MARCCGGARTEDCKCRELFKLYISSNHSGYVGTVLIPGNIEKLMKGKTLEQRGDIISELEHIWKNTMVEIKALAGKE